jgi:hypothetical protein
MATDDAIRAADADREQVVAILQEAYAAGRLTLPEFDERTSSAFAGRTWGELRALTADLPEQPRLRPPPPAAPPPGAVPPGRLPGRRKPGRVTAGRLVPALPVAFFWIAISLFARGPGAYVPIVILLLIGLKFACSQQPDDDGGRNPRPHGPARPPGRGTGR